MRVIVPSCAAYSDTWVPFMFFMKKFWPEQADVHLVTDHVPGGWRGSYTTNVGIDLGWSQNLKNGLLTFTEELVVLMLDDFWLTDPVDDQRVRKLERAMLDNPDIGCMRIFPCPGADRRINDDYGEVDAFAPYRISTQAAIWRRTALLDLIDKLYPRSSPWDFEIFGSSHEKALRVTSVYRDGRWPMYYLMAILRGQWDKNAIELCKKHKVNVDLSRRQVQA